MELTEDFLKIDCGYPLVKHLADGRWAVLIPQMTNNAIGIAADRFMISEKW
jgi:hypothetical protein